MRIDELDDFEAIRKLEEIGFDMSKSLDDVQEILCPNVLTRILGAPPGVFQGTPLYYAAACGDVRLIKILCGKGANPNKNITMEHGTTSDDGDNPLLISVRLGRAEAVKTLLELGADPAYVNGRRSVKYTLGEGRANHAGAIGFFFTQIEKRISHRDVNFDKVEQYLKEFEAAHAESRGHQPK